MSKLVVFDVDGTLLDSMGLLERVVEEYSRKRGLPQPDIEAIKHGYGAPDQHDFGWGVSRQEQVEHLYAAFDLMDRHAVSGLPHLTPQLFAGVEESLVHLKDTGHTLAIITSKSEGPLLHALEYHSVGRLFSTYRSADDVQSRGEREKPEPDMLHSVMRELRVAPEETAMVGDSTMDMRMGRAARANTIGVTWGAHLKEYLLEAGAHHIVERKFDDIVLTVKKIFG
ncbi:MAG: HAD-IA family hydrolase [Proteobacteria bacterium]|nr:HAD-IA family hydrolase [Pseudomonadota bacterium]